MNFNFFFLINFILLDSSVSPIVFVVLFFVFIIYLFIFIFPLFIFNKKNFVIHSDWPTLFVVVVAVDVGLIVVAVALVEIVADVMVVDCCYLALIDSVITQPVVDCWPRPALLSDVLVLRLHAVYVLKCPTFSFVHGAVPLPLLLTYMIQHEKQKKKQGNM